MCVDAVVEVAVGCFIEKGQDMANSASRAPSNMNEGEFEFVADDHCASRVFRFFAEVEITRF